MTRGRGLAASGTSSGRRRAGGGRAGFGDAVAAIRVGALDVDTAAGALVARLTDRELLGLLDGDAAAPVLPLIPFLLHRRPFVGGAVPRLGIPGLRFSDGPRGVVLGRSTAFPVAIARAATWDAALEEEVGVAIGLETRAQGANYSASVCVNLLRHPAWGRAQECFGEDPVLASRMGAATTRGVRRNAMVCVKHLACNSIEDARFEVDVRVDEHALHEVYLPAFKAVVDAGADSVMSAYNSVNGAYMDVNRALLTDVLRDEWGFRGFTSSDWVFGVHDGVASVEAGLDVEMPLQLVRAGSLPDAARDGRLPKALVLRSARRILRTCLLHAATRMEEEPARSAVASPAHRALARRAAAGSMVLLQNREVDGRALLPLPAGVRSVAVLGALATAANLGDHGSSRVRPPTTCSPLQGLREALPEAVVAVDPGSDLRRAAAVARSCEVAVVVVGMGQHDEGESVVTGGIDPAVLGPAFRHGPLRPVVAALTHLAARFVLGGDRATLSLRPADERLIRAAVTANPRTVVVLIGGSAIVMERWRHAVPALLQAWYPGMEGGRALADVLTGVAEPGGRLPFAVPRDPAHLPFFDHDATSIVYDAWWGQRLLDRDGHEAAFPFGFGLGYTVCTLDLVEHDGVTARVRVRNTGARAGATVVQVYAVEAEARIPQLVGFAKARVEVGEERVVDVALDLSPTRWRDPATRTWSDRPGEWRIVATQHSPSSLEGSLPLR